MFNIFFSNFKMKSLGFAYYLQMVCQRIFKLLMPPPLNLAGQRQHRTAHLTSPTIGYALAWRVRLSPESPSMLGFWNIGAKWTQ